MSEELFGTKKDEPEKPQSKAPTRSAKSDPQGYVVKERADRMVKVGISTVVFRRDELITSEQKLALARQHGINLKPYVD